MKWSIGTKIIGTTSILDIFFIGSLLVCYQQANARLSAASWIAHTHLVLVALDELTSETKEAEIREKAYILTEDPKFLEPYLGSERKILGTLTNLKKLTEDNPNQQTRIETLSDLVDKRRKILQSAVDSQKGKNFETSLSFMKSNEMRDIISQIGGYLERMKSEEKTLLAERETIERRKEETGRDIIFASIALGIFLVIALGFYFRSNIAKPLVQITDIANKIALGDLSVQMATTARKDEVGDLSRTFSKMIQNLKSMSVRMKEGSTLLATAATEILSVTSQAVNGATETASAVRETTVTVEEVKQTAQVANQKAKYVSDSAKQAADVSVTGKKFVEDSIEGMNQIRKQMEGISDSILKFSEQTQSISEILLSVNDLAEQSNLLSVNASIEAAKAGEHGKGFVIVAREVKALAEQSKKATNQVRTILNDMSKATSKVIMSAEQGIKTVDSGLQQVNQSGNSIRSLTDTITENVQAAGQIALSGQQQLIGIDQVSIAMTNILQASDQNVSGTRQVEIAAKNLNDLGQTLKQLSEEFKV